ncbi:MAG: hypothetical protein LBQ90_05075 [Synergistaceae bacterium]|jgi:hypothetical protein|nr:hypothetical protein [Synergistaceae bacterium]
MMIPRVEDILIAELERRIVAAMPDTAPGDGTTPETFITVIEERTVTRNVQEQNALTIFAWVTAEIAVIVYSQKRRYDYSPLLADFAGNPMIKLGDGVFAKVEIEKSEAVEGPYLSNDAWLFKATYPIVGVEDGRTWQPPNIANVTVGVQEIYPRTAAE